MVNFTLLLGVGTVLALTYLLTGFVGYRQVLNGNPCKMTYSRPAQYPVIYNMTGWEYNLRKISNGSSKKLNPQPVLFIPGHLGSHHQSRSFASELPNMHNEDQFFQYFALDFNEGPVALHAGDVVDKAAFTNEALKQIRDLYETTNPDVNVLILGHSYGGMIARTSMLLSNHPKCMVNTIFMLSTPITRAPYGPDSSFEFLFNTVNKAWFSASYNTSAACAVSIPVQESSKKISLNPHCPSKCVRRTRLVNIGGGDIDIMVPSDVTDLFELSARPRNSSISGPKTRVYTLEKYFQIKDSLKHYFVSATTLVVSAVNAISGTISNSNSTIPVNITVLSTSPNNTAERSDEVLVEAMINNTNSPFAYITPSIWTETILPYDDPQHVTIRSSQLVNVRFPVDHYAILWCHELANAVHDIMVKISRHGSGIIPWHEILPLHGSNLIREAVDEVSILEIANLNSFVSRNITNTLFHDAHMYDELHMRKFLSHPMMLSAVMFFVQNVAKILSCVIGVVILSISNHILRGLLGNSGDKSSSDKKNKKKASYFLIAAGLDAYETLLSSVVKSVQSNLMECSVIGAVIIAIVVGYSIRNNLITQNSTWLVMNMFLCILVAIPLKVIICLVIQVVAFLAYWISLPLRIVIGLISYPWKYLHGMLSRIQPVGSALDLLARNIYDFAATSLLLTIIYTASNKPQFVNLGRSNVIFSTCAICFLILSVFISVVTLTKKETTYGTIESKNGYKKLYTTDFLALYLSAQALAIPSFLFAGKQLYDSQPVGFDLTDVYTIFGPGRINYCLTILSIYLHIRSSSNFSSFLSEMNGLAFLKNLKTNAGRKMISNPHCYHEDGGPRAVLEPFDPNSPGAEQLVSINGSSIVIGPTFKVVSCDCPKNRDFKSYEEWCEFCKCENCGGKNIVRSRQSDNLYDRNDDFSVNLDLILWLIVFSVAGYVVIFSSDQLYVNLYATGIVAISCYIRQCFSSDSVSLKML